MSRKIDVKTVETVVVMATFSYLVEQSYIITTVPCLACGCVDHGVCTDFLFLVFGCSVFDGWPVASTY